MGLGAVRPEKEPHCLQRILLILWSHRIAESAQRAAVDIKLNKINNFECLAERVGFEPTVLVKVHTLSKRAP